MALLLAPFNSAMRIGMGFNSYTQSLCTNDVVRLPGGVRASDKDLRKIEAQQGAIDGQADTSQVVSWKAGFVESLSEVTDTLNISGALKIQIAAIGGGGSASAHYIDTTKFIKADVKYSINVDVMNQRLVAEDVTEFTPIPNVPASKFQEVYGNCYISGFIEGGVLSALITKTQLDDSKLKDIGGELSVNFDVKVAKIEGSAKGGKVNEDKSTVTKTDIMLSWSGGGDIKPDAVSNWDMKSLSAVAMEFPDRVAACPQKTYAILTKYTSLRSFHEQTVKGSPLDYEIAGIYTSSLLDAYVVAIKDLNRGVAQTRKRSSNDKLREYGKLVAADYKTRMDRYNKFKEALKKANGDSGLLEEPLPPNAVVPYESDAFGLDVAQRDCRFEMIKIVREVNEVTYDPKVAIDPNRNWRFLSPNVFKMLCPVSNFRDLIYIGQAYNLYVRRIRKRFLRPSKFPNGKKISRNVGTK
ncbi:hypothetical protein EJ08DRAFT_641341 [Tothia fuscella]|uniref:Uncharacterized protein n=1 Tax=Tothia fuscella TaxID=1048955 RepID=A0A9P4TTY4_9PEZI|nr:hypothetical protein EJ08DRAFT_641341 [Tothia fuscella]